MALACRNSCCPFCSAVFPWAKAGVTYPCLAKASYVQSHSCVVNFQLCACGRYLDPVIYDWNSNAKRFMMIHDKGTGQPKRSCNYFANCGHLISLQPNSHLPDHTTWQRSSPFCGLLQHASHTSDLLVRMALLLNKAGPSASGSSSLAAPKVEAFIVGMQYT